MHRHRNQARQGFTLIEVLVTSMVLLTALGIFSSTVVGVTRQRLISLENRVASNASRTAIEAMHNEDLDRVFALFNADETDDPGGIGTAPGHQFAVPGLSEALGEISFPTIDVGGTPQKPLQELREDLVSELFGTPRDLNGDNLIDDQDHSGDYVLLPVQVDIRWRGRVGDLQHTTSTTLCFFRRS